MSIAPTPRAFRVRNRNVNLGHDTAFYSQGLQNPTRTRRQPAQQHPSSTSPTQAANPPQTAAPVQPSTPIQPSTPNQQTPSNPPTAQSAPVGPAGTSNINTNVGVDTSPLVPPSPNAALTASTQTPVISGNTTGATGTAASQSSPSGSYRTARSQSSYSPSRHSSSVDASGRPLGSTISRGSPPNSATNDNLPRTPTPGASSPTPPPSNPSSLAPAPPNRYFQRMSLASTSFVVPQPLRGLLNVKKLILEYKRLSPYLGQFPFDVYTLQLFGVHDTDVDVATRTFMPPYAALHCRTTENHGSPRKVYQCYVPVTNTYTPPTTIPFDGPCIADTRATDSTVYDISEFSFNLNNDKRQCMGFILPFVYLLYHIVLTYIRYLGAVSNFLPILGSCSFAGRMTLRLGSGLVLSQMYSDPAILAKSFYGIFVQCLLYRQDSPVPEIRDILALTPFYVWLLINGLFYLISRAVEMQFPGYHSSSEWAPKLSLHTFWDIVGLGLNPLAIVTKLGVTYLFYSRLVNGDAGWLKFHKGVREGIHYVEEELRGAQTALSTE